MGNNRFDLLSLGEILLRLSPPDNERIVSGETFQKQVGGAELNVVSGVSILGLRTGVVSKLPDNALGIYAKDKVRFCGVSDDFWYMMTVRMPVSGFTTMRMVLIRESREWCMTEDTLLLTRSVWKNCQRRCSRAPDVSTQAGSHWH